MSVTTKSRGLAWTLPPKNGILSPESVNHARTAIAAYPMSAARRRSIQNPVAQAWIRTTERRKAGQIYSLLALTAHPPVHDERTTALPDPVATDATRVGHNRRDGREPTCYQRTAARLCVATGAEKP